MQHVYLNNGDSVSHAPGDKLYSKRKQIYLGKYNLMFHTALGKVSKDAYEAMPTLGVLISKVERENLARVRPTVIALCLDVSQATVDRHLKKLHELKIILPDEAEAGKTRAITNWRLCPYIAWRGSVETLAAYLKNIPKDHPWRKYEEETAYNGIYL